MDGSLLSKELFPEVSFCFAYGSGAVIQDDNKEDDNKMLDLVFVVEDPLEWHKINLENNAHHYASHMRISGPNIITHVQNGYSAGMYYNTLIPMRGSGQLMKYGVISRKELERDLHLWHTLYLAGRLHKPVVFMSTPDEKLSAMLRSNLLNAVHTALYLLPEQFSRLELYLAIAGLSYSGDFRMVFGENPDKVKNIVVPNMHLFDKLYSNVLKEVSFVNTPTSDDSSDAIYNQDMSPASRQQLYSSLPQVLIGSSVVPETPPSVSLVKTRLESIVLRSSIRQSLKGIATAGPIKSANYTATKISKWAAGWGKRILK